MPALNIVVIGAGAAGGLAVARICDAARKAAVTTAKGASEPLLSITVVEAVGSRGLWRGAAYSATNHAHLVNIAHTHMSLDATDPLHFTKWLDRHPDPAVRAKYHIHEDAPAGPAPSAELGGTVFAPRALFGEYLEEHVEAAIKAAAGVVSVTTVTGVAVGHQRAESGGTVQLQDGQSLPYDTMVISTGNADVAGDTASRWFAKPGAGAGEPVQVPSAFIRDTWDALRGVGAALQRALDLPAPPARDAPLRLVLLGARLTAVDVLQALETEGYTNVRIDVVARKGLMPRANVGEFHTPGGLEDDGFLRSFLAERHPEVLEAATDPIGASSGPTAVVGTDEGATRQARGLPILPPAKGADEPSRYLKANEVAQVLVDRLKARAMAPLPNRVSNDGHTNNWGYDRNALMQAISEQQDGRVPWQCIIDAVRPLEDAIWLSLCADERKVFLSQWRDAWETHRHRIAPIPAATLDAARKCGAYVEHTGGIERIEVLPAASAPAVTNEGGLSPALRVVTRSVDGAPQTTVDAHAVLMCMGPTLDYRLRAHGGPLQAEGSLIGSLVASGDVVAEPSGMGLLCDPSTGRAVAVKKKVPAAAGSEEEEDHPYTYSQSIFISGVPRRGSQWEAIALKEIRHHGDQVAQHLLRSMGL